MDGSKTCLDMNRVPEGLRPLLPYAEFWGVSDDFIRESLVREASPLVRSNLSAVVQAHQDELDQWLAGPEADSPTPTKEYVAFSAPQGHWLIGVREGSDAATLTGL